MVARARRMPSQVPVARWADADKDGVGTAIGETSRVWFSTAHGILTEAFYPSPDQACIRLLELVVTDGDAFVSEEARDTQHAVAMPSRVAPLCSLLNSCSRGRYELEKEVLADPRSDVILQRVRFTPLQVGNYRVFCVLEPHLGNQGDDNTAELGEHKGVPMLFASRADGLALALACSQPFIAATAGFVGADGRAQLRAAGRLTSRCERAPHGNVSLAAEIDHRAAARADDGGFTLALAFARTTGEAAHLALGALHRGYETARKQFLTEWEEWTASLEPCKIDGAEPRLWTRSVAVLKTLEAKHPNGGRVAALSTPWGPSRGPGIDGTYHLIWTRDLVESVGALLATRAHDEARHALHYLRCTQEADGHWPQNMHLDGEPFWNGIELDEVALPIVFLHLVRRNGVLTGEEIAGHWEMVRRAAGYIACHGPATDLDRWEDTGGITPFTIGSAIVALLVAAELGEQCGHGMTAACLRDLADQWNDSVEGWLYRRGGALAERVGVEGYYVRARELGKPFADVSGELARTEVSPDALALVRFGLRAADDPRIENTVRVIDAVLRADLPGGPSWRRYPGDRYGEHADGAPFDGGDGGIGRPWPLLTGERAHYELARGHRERAMELLHAMESFANASGCLPEQVWDQPDVRARGLVYGGPSGSAAPLGWAHGEYVKLCRSLAEGRVLDLPEHAAERYVQRRTRPEIATWRVGDPIEPLRAGKLRVACRAPATIAWTSGDGTPIHMTPTIDTGLGLHVAELAGDELRVRIRHATPRPGDGTELTFSTQANHSSKEKTS
jgi:glucoamylase